jgi:hypothetical protein
MNRARGGRSLIGGERLRRERESGAHFVHRQRDCQSPPVGRHSTCSTGHDTSRAVSAAMSRAACIPSLPVQALAQARC